MTFLFMNDANQYINKTKNENNPHQDFDGRYVHTTGIL